MASKPLNPNKGAASIVAPRQNFNERREHEAFINDTHSNDRNRHTVKTGRIYLVTIAANIASIATGTCMSWSSPVGPKLTAADTSDSPLDRPLTANENAWIASICAIGAVTPFIAGPLADKIGRKKVLLLSSIFFILGYILLLFGQAFWVLLAARTILGFGIGFAMCTIPMYVGEISTDETRGATGAIMPLSITFGGFYVYCIGPYVSYMVLQMCCLLVPIIFDIAFIFMPESPYYFVAKGQREEAAKSLQFLRGQDSQRVEAELDAIENFVTHSMADRVDKLNIVKTAGNRKALLISIGLVFFQQISGVGVVNAYTQKIFENANVTLDAPIAAIIVGSVQLITSGVAPIVVKNFRRKIILLYATVFMSISLAAFGYFFYSQKIFGHTNGITWVPITAMVAYNMAFGLGFGPIPWAVIGEIFPPDIKAFATAVTTSFISVIGFLIILFYPSLEAVGNYYAFWFFAIFCVLAFFFVFFIVIETKDRSFEEIQEKLNKII